MKARKILTILFSLIYVGALFLFSWSPFMAARQALSDGDAPAPSARPVLSLGKPTVDFSGGSFPEDATEIAVVLQKGEAKLLDRLSKLTRADLSGSRCYDEILAWAEEHPEVALRYTVLLPNGQEPEDTAQSLDLTGLSSQQFPETLGLLPYLPQVSSVELGETALSAADLAALREALPEAVFSGSVTLLDKSVSLAEESLDLSGIAHDQVQSAAEVLPGLTQLKTLTLGSSENGLSLEDAGILAAACPQAKVDYRFTLWNRTVNLSDEVLDLNHVSMNDQGEAVRKVLPYMRACKVLDMDSCGVDNAHMAQIRDENPDVEVIWRVWFGTDYSVRTNVTKILASMPSKGGTLYDSVGDQLRYCTKVRYLDLGHNADIADFGFVRNMPDLEIAVISMSNVSDLSPFASCQNLKYLETFNTPLKDLSPLAECKSLRHLNVATCLQLSDISPLYDLDLKRLWLGVGDPVPKEQVEEMQRRHPDCEINTTVSTGIGPGADAEGPVQGNWKCYQQYLKADWEHFANTGFFPAQRPLGWYKVVFKCFQFNLGNGAYSFSWNDPKLNPHDGTVKPVNTHVIDTSFLDEDFEVPETIIPDKLDDPPGELLYESEY